MMYLFTMCSSRVAFFGVFDGHAGPRASKFTADHLHKNIMANLPKGGHAVVLSTTRICITVVTLILGKVQNLDREVRKCLIEAFKKTDEEFLAKASAASPSWKVRVQLQHSRCKRLIVLLRIYVCSVICICSETAITV